MRSGSAYSSRASVSVAMEPMFSVMRITLVLVGLMVVGCAAAEGEMAGQGPDSGTMAQAETGTGGTGGAAPATGGSGGAAATGGSGGAGSGGAGGSSQAPDAGAPKMDAMASVDSKPASTEPVACDSGSHMLYAYACTSPPTTTSGKALYKDGRPCNTCATAKASGAVEKQYVGCLAAAGAICVMDCSECKPQ